MTDGPTGIQVAPITEDDMSRVTDILKRAADAIVGMSQLSADVDMLRKTVAGLQADCERLRNQNNALDEALAHSRSVRDVQASELAQVKADFTQAVADRDRLYGQVNVLQAKVENLSFDLDTTKRERDDHGFRVMELEEELRKANAKLDSIREGYRSIFGEEPKALQPEPQLTPVALEPTQPVAEAPKPAEPAPTEVDWSKPYHWDAFLGRYVNDAA